MKALRGVLIVHAVLLASQAMFAGQFLSGADAIVILHERVGEVAAVVALIQIVICAADRVPRGSFVAFLVTSILILLAEGLQIGTGYGRFLAVHVPLGAIVLAGVVAQIVWVFR